LLNGLQKKGHNALRLAKGDPIVKQVQEEQYDQAAALAEAIEASKKEF
jgi:hypothetical protein